MNVGTLFLLTILYGLLILMIQRAELRRRLLIALLLIPLILVVHAQANARSVGSESATALIAALALNLLFWVFVGRYNPVGSSDDIQVIGKDD